MNTHDDLYRNHAKSSYRSNSGDPTRLVNMDEVISAYRSELRALRQPNKSLQALPGVTRRLTEVGAPGFVCAYDLAAADMTDAIQEQITYFQGEGKSFEWKVFSWDPPDLRFRLEAAGFEVGEMEKLVVYPLDQGLEGFDQVWEVTRVQSFDELQIFKEIAERCFGKDYSQTVKELAQAIRLKARGHDAFIAVIDGTAATVGRLYTHPDSAFAGLHGAGTLPEFRGRGGYRSVIRARAVEAIAAKARYLQVDALPTSLPILLRLGFNVIAETRPCTLQCPSNRDCKV